MIDSFSILDHEFVPLHTLLSKEESETLLSTLNIQKHNFPKIKKNDAALLELEKIKGEIPEGSIIKITRKSETAQEYTFYRVVIGG